MTTKIFAKNKLKN